MTVEDEPEPAPNPRGRGCLIPAVIASTILVLMCGAGGILRYASVLRVAPTSTGPTTTPPTQTAAVPSPSPTPSATEPPTTTPPPTTSPKPPRVDTLKVSQAPTCPSTGSGHIQLQWTVSGGATGSQLFADGGLVNTYGKTQTVTLGFACAGSPGATVTHTYTVKTVGGAPQATRSVTASATIPA